MISLVLHKDKIKHPERKPDYLFVFMIYLAGVLYILGAVTGYIGIVVFLTTMMLLIFTRFYVKKKYPYSDSDIKEKIPKKYEKAFNVTAKLNKIIGICFVCIILISFAIVICAIIS